MPAIQRNIHEIIDALPEEKLEIAFQYLKDLKDSDNDSATSELMNDEILKEIKEGIKEINSGKFSEFGTIRRDV